MNDTEKINDSIVEGYSNCCSAKVYEPDICSECMEHCEVDPVIEEELD